MESVKLVVSPIVVTVYLKEKQTMFPLPSRLREVFLGAKSTSCDLPVFCTNQGPTCEDLVAACSEKCHRRLYKQKRKYDISVVVSMIFYVFTPILGEMIQFDEHIFQVGWFNHQPDMDCEKLPKVLGDNYVLLSAPQNIPESKHQTPQVRYDRLDSTRESLLSKSRLIGWVFIKRDEELLSYIRDYNEPW